MNRCLSLSAAILVCSGLASQFKERTPPTPVVVTPFSASETAARVAAAEQEALTDIAARWRHCQPNHWRAQVLKR